MKELSTNPHSIYIREWRKKRKEQGLCRECDNKVEEGKSSCIEHLKKDRKKYKEKCGYRIVTGTCLKCKKPVVPGYQRCIDHIIYQKNYSKKQKEKYKSMGLCSCGRKRDPLCTTISCGSCLENYKRNRENKI